jgi:hypothetical protein
MESECNIYNFLFHFMAHIKIETLVKGGGGEEENYSLNKRHTCMLPSASPVIRSEV